jgi:hypothetical protein
MTSFATERTKRRQNWKPPMEAVEANVGGPEDEFFNQSKCTE